VTDQNLVPRGAQSGYTLAAEGLIHGAATKSLLKREIEQKPNLKSDPPGEVAEWLKAAPC
jgi:hypothetical protein